MIDQAGQKIKARAEQPVSNAMQSKRKHAGVQQNFPAGSRRRVARLHRIEISNKIAQWRAPLISSISRQNRTVRPAFPDARRHFAHSHEEKLAGIDKDPAATTANSAVERRFDVRFAMGTFCRSPSLSGCRSEWRREGKACVSKCRTGR